MDGRGGPFPPPGSNIGGLGVGAAKTADAIMKLPAAVTLAFTPYGSDPGKLVERARAQRRLIRAAAASVAPARRAPPQ